MSSGNATALSAGAHPGTIIYAGGFELPDRNAAALRVRANALIFRDLGYRVVLLETSKACPADGNIYPAQSGEVDIEGWEVGYPATSMQWLRQIVSDEAVRRLIDKLQLRDLALIICYNYPAIAQMRIRSLAHRHGALAIADVTEWYSAVKNDSAANVVKNLDVPLRMRWVNPCMDGLITTSSFVTRHYAATGLPIVELPSLMTNAPKEISNGFSRDGVRRLFFAGTGFDPAAVANSRDGLKDRLDWVIETLAAAKALGARFRLDLFGVERDAYIALIPHHSVLLDDLADWVTFHGRQPHAAVLGELAMADFSIFFRKETRTTLAGFPTKYAESIAYGTPVITNAMPSLMPYHRTGETGFLVDATDLNKAAEDVAGILRLCDREIERMKGACTRSRLFHYSSYSDQVKEWLEMLPR